MTNSSLVCNSAKSCETCVRDASCFWCESQVSCKVYDVKSKDEQTKACGEWRWKSCKKADASASLIAIISGSASAALICVLLVLVCIKRDLWKRVISSRLYDRREKEGLFEQEERLNRKEKHEKNQSNKAQKFAEKYELKDPSKAFLYSP